MWLVGALLNSTDTEHSITAEKFYWIVLYQIIIFSDYPKFAVERSTRGGGLV